MTWLLGFLAGMASGVILFGLIAWYLIHVPAKFPVIVPKVKDRVKCDRQHVK